MPHIDGVKYVKLISVHAEVCRPYSAEQFVVLGIQGVFVSYSTFAVDTMPLRHAKVYNFGL